MDRWRSRSGKSQRREEKRRRRSEKRKSQRKEDAGARKGRKAAAHCVLQWFVAPEGRKVGSLKRRVQSHLARWEMNNVHAVVAPSTFRSQNAQSTPGWEHFWKLRCRKSARRCRAKHIRTTFGVSDVVSRSRRKGLCTLFKVSKTWRFSGISKNAGRRGTFEEDPDAFSVAGAIQETCSSEILGGPGADFLREEHQIFSFGKMILRDRCSTSYDLASLLRGRRRTLDRWSGKIAKRIGTRPSALHSTFHVWRRSHRIASFLMLPAEEVSQGCFLALSRPLRIPAVLMLASY